MHALACAWTSAAATAGICAHWRGGYAIIWEPAWPEERIALRDPSRKAVSFRNLTEHVQGNHLLRPREIIAALERVGMKAQAHLFAGGTEAVIVAQR